MTRVAVVGAGVSGIAACRALSERSIDFVCFEKGSKIGGLWRFNNDSGQSPAYRSLYFNNSKYKMRFDDWPVPDDYPDFPHHSLVLKYIESYVEQYQLHKNMRFNQTVEDLSPVQDGWAVTLADGRTEKFTHVIVANGHHWEPKWPNPEIPGAFNGLQIHSRYFVDAAHPHDLRGKRVVVMGTGNSAMDIACELSRQGTADRVWLAIRTGVHIIPKYFGSAVLDHELRYPTEEPDLVERIFNRLLSRNARSQLINSILEKKVRNAVGEPQDFGMPKPPGKFDKNRMAISNEIHSRLGNGDVLPKPAIKQFDGDNVEFADGSIEQADAIIYCTGYKVSIPFLSQQLFDTTGDDVVLYKRVVSPMNKGLLFVGLVDPVCALMPIAQIQSRLVTAIIDGRYQLPSEAAMQASVQAELAYIRKNYPAADRYSIRLDCLDYSNEIQQEGVLARPF